MKRIFSIEKCKKALGEFYSCNDDYWITSSDGLTVEEMGELGFMTEDEWMIDVEEIKKIEDLIK